MKRKILLLSTICMIATGMVAAQENVRISELFNFGWKFSRVNPDDTAALPSLATYDDSGWRSLDLPHDFQFEQPWEQSAGGSRGFKAMGAGWYRKHFKADPAWKGKRVLLDFEGIIYYGDVYLNGHKAGSTDYGYVGFEADVSKWLNFDGDNVVAVYSSTGKTGGSRWYTGGGLFRDVHLVVKDSVAIARHGVFITASGISEQSASVQVQVEVEGVRTAVRRGAAPVEIAVKIFSPDGRQVAETGGTVPVKSKKQTEEVQTPAVSVARPQLWDCEHPNLYTAEVTLLSGGKTIDRVTERFGIRTVEFSKEYGFRLNGKKIFLKGVANHHDLGAVGAAAHEEAIVQLMNRLKEFGYNHIRTSHNPYSEAFMRIADEKGLLIVDELYDKWSSNVFWGGRKPWTETVFRDLPEWIRRDRNHPSVILWSFGNELQMREDFAGFPTGDFGITTYRMLDVLAKRYDPTRKTTVAMFPARAGGMTKEDPEFDVKVFPPELAPVTDIASFNYRWFNYQQYLQHAPDMIIYQSEATTNDLVAPYFGMDREKMIGLAYWGAVEYWGESHGYPRKGWNYSYFDHALNPYPQAYLIKSCFSDEPLVHIGIVDKAAETIEWNAQTVGTLNVSDHWNRKEGNNYNILTFTNADEVELLVNGKSFGRKANNTDVRERNIISWNSIPYQAGKITAIARTADGREVARHEVQTAGKAVALKTVASGSSFRANGMDLQYIKVYAIDAKGRVTPDAAGEITFDVTGAARIIAVDNGDHSSEELFDGNKRQLHKGFAMAILRAGQLPGEVKIKASCKGLKSAEIKLEVKK